jgi:hypothetical protein
MSHFSAEAAVTPRAVMTVAASSLAWIFMFVLPVEKFDPASLILYATY